MRSDDLCKPSSYLAELRGQKCGTSFFLLDHEHFASGKGSILISVFLLPNRGFLTGNMAVHSAASKRDPLEFSRSSRTASFLVWVFLLSPFPCNIVRGSTPFLCFFLMSQLWNHSDFYMVHVFL